MLGPRFKFAKHGKCGAELSEMLPHLAKVVDDIAILKSVHTDQFNHAPAQIFFNTGFGQPGRPSMGSWVTYGLGCETKDLPAFVVMSTGGGHQRRRGQLVERLPADRLHRRPLPQPGRPDPERLAPAGVDAETAEGHARPRRRPEPDAARRRSAIPRSPRASPPTRWPFRLQTAAPELMDLKKETKETLELYGVDPDKPSFARACLLARRMVERGVRFVNIYHEGWDAHSDVAGNLKTNCGATDQASRGARGRPEAARPARLHAGRSGAASSAARRWWRSNPALGRSLGRDHHPQAFTIWMAGGGIKPGVTLRQDRRPRLPPVENPVHVHDLQATILHRLGFDHEKLTFRHAGRDFRLTDVFGKVIPEVLA